MTDDAMLLLAYARDRSETAFAELVKRHIGFVYAAALRQVNGDAHLAQDVTQAVFTDLARKAPALARHPSLVGWLFTSTRFAAAKLIRGEQRRRAREQEVQLMPNDATSPDENLDWDRVRPVLDEALAELNDRDRQAILLRCLQDWDFARVGAQLELSDNAARMCVERALDKLRVVLARRGIRSTTAALAVALAHQAAVAAPASLVTTITNVALAGAGAGGGLLTFMSLTKLQMGVASALVLAGTGAALIQDHDRQNLQRELAATPAAAVADRARLRQSNLELKAAARTRAGEAALPLNQLDHMPVVMVQVPPAYPYALREAKTSGSVLIEMVIDSTGKVAEAKVVKSTAKEFEEPTLQAVNRWLFTPGLHGGRQVSTRVTQEFRFDPTGAGSDAPASSPPTWF